ncbi:unnamed protein product [Aphanomyces euteiches]
MQRYSKLKYPFPVKGTEWGTSEDEAELVSPKITKHGTHVIQNMGKYFGAHLYPTLANIQCSDAFAYADNNERDIVTAQQFLSGFLPSCTSLVPTTNDTRLLFEQGQDSTAICPATSESIYSGVVGDVTTANLVRIYKPEIKAINDLVGCCEPVLCDLNSTASCDLFGVPSRWSGKFYEPWQDTLSEAQFLSEWFLLQSLNNMTIPPPLTLDDIVQLGVLHKVHMDLITNQFNAENFGSTLLVHIVASMQQAIQGSPIPIPPGAGPHLLQSLTNKFLFYAGHDINLLYLRDLLRLEWETAHWLPNQPNVGSMLVFELHSYVNNSALESDYYVEAYFVTATPNQIRNAETLSSQNPPDRVLVSIPHCSHDVVLADGKVATRCNYTNFKEAARLAIRQACVSPTLAKYAKSMPSGPRETAWSFKVVVVAAVSIALLIVLWKYITLLNAPSGGNYAALK